MKEKFKVTILIEADEDPSGILDEFERFVQEDTEYNLEPLAEEEGEAVTVESYL